MFHTTVIRSIANGFRWLNSDIPAGSWYEQLKEGAKRSFVIVCILAALAAICACTGCQSDFTVSTSNKVFYKNTDGSGGSSDARTGMYDGSGYHERVNGGDVKSASGFRTIGQATGH